MKIDIDRTNHHPVARTTRAVVKLERLVVVLRELGEGGGLVWKCWAPIRHWLFLGLRAAKEKRSHSIKHQKIKDQKPKKKVSVRTGRKNSRKADYACVMYVGGGEEGWKKGFVLRAAV